MENFFTTPRLLRELKMKRMASTGTVRVKRTEKAILKAVEEMKKLPKGSHNVVVDTKSNVTLVRWKDNKVVIVASALYGQQSIRKAKRYIKDKGVKVDIDQRNHGYNKAMGGVDRMDQNISYYMTNIHSKKWW